jgi:hypothetical protein
MNLPDLHTANLDAGTLDALFNDIEALGSGVEVRVKGAAGDYAADAVVALREAERRFKNREVSAIQLRYRWSDESWVDTVLHTPQGARVVRINVGDLRN